MLVWWQQKQQQPICAACDMPSAATPVPMAWSEVQCAAMADCRHVFVSVRVRSCGLRGGWTTTWLISRSTAAHCQRLVAAPLCSTQQSKYERGKKAPGTCDEKLGLIDYSEAL